MTKQQRARRERDEGIARQLMAMYAQGLTLIITEAKEAHVLTEHMEEGKSPLQTVYWYWKEGLTALLHEIGHLHVEHDEEMVTYPQDVRDVIVEAMAWFFAESVAKKNGIWFDYPYADKCYATYTGPLPVQMKWRYR